MRLKKYLNEGKWGRNFVGNDDGTWWEPVSLLGGDWDWEMIAGMSSQNDRKNYMVEGATETHSGFIKALKEIVKSYPELKKYLIKFDSPDWKLIEDLLGMGKFDWKKLKFFHGTSEFHWETIKKTGMKSRGKTGVEAGYGSGVSASKGRKDAIYLTTQRSMANFAAIDSSRVTKSKEVILQIDGKYLDSKYYIPDEDSRETDAKMSLDRMGSVGYTRDIPSKAIKRIK